MASPSLRGRGLKLRLALSVVKLQTVALFARAWIEMTQDITEGSTTVSRPLCEGVD